MNIFCSFFHVLILNECKDVEYQANRCLPFIIDKISLNKDLTGKLEQVKSCFRLLKNIFEHKFLML